MYDCFRGLSGIKSTIVKEISFRSNPLQFSLILVDVLKDCLKSFVVVGGCMDLNHIEPKLNDKTANDLHRRHQSVNWNDSESKE